MYVHISVYTFNSVCCYISVNLKPGNLLNQIKHVCVHVGNGVSEVKRSDHSPSKDQFLLSSEDILPYTSLRPLDVPQFLSLGLLLLNCTCKQKINMPMQRCDNMALLDASIKIENATEVCLVGWIPSIL